MIQNLTSMEGQEDLRIVEHLDMQKLPESVQQMISLARAVRRTFGETKAEYGVYRKVG